MKGSYYEVRYEDMCFNPLQEVEKLFEFMNISMKTETSKDLSTQVHTKGIGKWKKLQLTDEESGDFQNAIDFGKPLLEELGYL